MKTFGTAALLLALALVTGDRAFGFSHDGVRPIGYSNILNAYGDGCGGYVPQCACTPDIWAGVTLPCGRHRCYGQAGCNTCATGITNSSVVYGESAISNVTISTEHTATVEPATQSVQEISIQAPQAAAVSEKVEVNAAAIPAKTEKVEVSPPPAAALTDTVDETAPTTPAKVEKAEVSEAPAANLSEKADVAAPVAAAEDLKAESTTAAAPADTAVATPNSEVKPAQPAVDAKASKSPLDVTPAEVK